MNLNWKNQLREIRKLLFRQLVKVGLVNFSVVAPLAIGGSLVLVPESVQARPTCGSCVIAQVEEVYEEVSPATQIEADSSEQAQSRPYGYYGQSYLLYVPTYSIELVDFVQRLVPDAGGVPDDYVRRYRRGRNGFPVGVYNFEGAQRRAKRLMREGIAVEMIPLNRYGSVNNQDRPGNSRFVVYITARSTTQARTLLRSIRQIAEPYNARRTRRTITVRGFNNRDEAELFANQLVEELDIDINRISVGESTLANPQFTENENRLSSSENENNFNKDDSYMVVIPANEEELPVIEAQVRQMGSSLGTNPEIYQAEDSNGKYIMVGPFEERITAEQVERYLQDSGMTNARVSIDR